MFSFFEKDNQDQQNEKITQVNSDEQQNHNMVKLKTGYELEGNVVKAILHCLTMIKVSDPMGFVYLLEKCRDPDFKLMPYTIQVLNTWDFLENGKVPEEVKNVFLSATMAQEDEKASSKILLSDPIDHVQMPKP